MRFKKRFFFSLIQEWREHYIDYEGLRDKIKHIKSAALDLATAYASISKITGKKDLSAAINVGKMQAEENFWKSLDENVTRVEVFYTSQIDHFTDQFHILTLQAIKLDLIDDYQPFTRGLSTRLERELERLNIDLPIELGISYEDRKHKTLDINDEQLLFPLRKNTSFEQVLKHKVSAPSKPSTDSITTTTEVNTDSGYDTDTSNHSHDDSSGDDHEPTPGKPQRDSLLVEEIQPKENQHRGGYKQKRNNGSSSRSEKESFDVNLRNLSMEDLSNKDQHKSSFKQFAGEPPIKDRKKAILQLRRAFAEFYRGLCMLQNFAQLNSEAIGKILKKHDENIELGYKDQYINNKASKNKFYRGVAHKSLIRETEHVFALCFTHGHRTQAMKKLRIPPQEQKGSTVTTFRFGLFFGLSITLFSLAIYLLTTMEDSLLEKLKPPLILFRALLLIILILWMWGIDMYIWELYRVNYIFIFEFNPRSHFKYHRMFEMASLLSLLFIFFLLTMIFSELQLSGFAWLGTIHSAVYPLVFLLIELIVFFWIQIRSNWWLSRTLIHIFMAPFKVVKFRDFYIADQLVSLAVITYDLSFAICFYSYDFWVDSEHHVCVAQSNLWIKPVLAFFPPLWRFLQCFRRYKDSKDHHQLLNAGKYSSSMFVVVFSALRGLKTANDAWLALWIFSCIVATIYGALWDILRDWSLANRNAKHPWLRDVTLYPVPWYYFSLITNTIMRLAWTLTISPGSIMQIMHPEMFNTFIAVIEIVRRGQWNIYRLENEQINNIGKFRALADVPVPLPLDNPWADQDKEKDSDEDDK